MKKLIRLFTVVFLISFAFVANVTSCKKDGPNLTKKEMLTAKTWKLLSSKSNGVANVIEDCEKDDFLNFAASGTYTVNPGTNKCDPEETTDSGTWLLSSDEKYMIVDGDSATIVELTASRFTFSMTYDKDKFEATYVSF